MKRDYIFLCLFSLGLLAVCYSDQQFPPAPPSYSPYSNHSLSNELQPNQRPRPPPPRRSPPPPPRRSPPPPRRSPPPPPRRSPPPPPRRSPPPPPRRSPPPPPRRSPPPPPRRSPPPPPRRSPPPPPRRSPPPPPPTQSPPPPHPSPPTPEINFFMLVETWPAGFCLPRQICRSDIPSNFTIHGLLPHNIRGPQEHDCDPNHKFNLEEVSTLVPQLLRDWPSLYSDEFSEYEWSYQWQMYGTCSGLEIKDYFELALNVYNTKDFKSILEEEGITPDPTKSIKKDEIVNAIHNAIGVYPRLYCHNRRGTRYLSQIGLCFNVSGESKDIEYQSCGAFDDKYCPSEDIYYLPVNPNNHWASVKSQ